MNLLITYNRAKDPYDPKFEEFTYGDCGRRGKQLSKSIEKGEYIFFLTNIAGKKAITAYYVVDRVLKVEDIAEDPDFKTKFRNPHLLRFLREDTSVENDYLVFGDPITSRVLRKPLILDRDLARQLSLNIQFPPGRTETQAIGSATRAFRKLTKADVRLLQKRIEKSEGSFDAGYLLSTEEVTEIIEKDVEAFLASKSAVIAEALKIKPGARILRRQIRTEAGRPDIVIDYESGLVVVVEVKLGRVGRDALHQIKRYVKDYRSRGVKNVKGILVCSGVMPAFEEEFLKQRDIAVLLYGWRIDVKSFAD